MEKHDNINAKGADWPTERDARLKMAEEVSRLLSRSESGHLKWKGHKSDLFEALHQAFITGRVVDEQGNPCSFKSMSRKACSLLRLTEPRNPWRVAAQAEQRKGMCRRSYTERYRWLLRHRNPRNPLEEEMLEEA